LSLARRGHMRLFVKVHYFLLQKSLIATHNYENPLVGRKHDSLENFIVGGNQKYMVKTDSHWQTLSGKVESNTRWYDAWTL
jgi:hypothetical protein